MRMGGNMVRLGFAAVLAATTAFVRVEARPAVHRSPVGCDPDNAGLHLPPGFCAGVFADTIRGVRHLVVASNGDVFVSDNLGSRSGIIALRDAGHTGHADTRRQFASGFQSSEVALFDGYLYAENGTGVVRFPLTPGDLSPSGPPDTIVSGLPGRGNHPFKTFAITRAGVMYVNVGSSTNVCPPENPERKPGADPCPELDRRAGIWKFDARKLHQTQDSGVHFARGVRNSVAITVDPVDQTLWTMQHGRDDLKNYPEFFTDVQSAELPAELLLHIKQGDDYGWPYCYYDGFDKETKLAPEYGGNGKIQGRCANVSQPVASFPAHWAPDGILFYVGSAFPEKFRRGVFVAFHGSWDRAPLPQAGYNVSFQPLADGKTSGDHELFAADFAPHVNERGARDSHRPVGLAEGPDGALYVTDDALGRIYKIQYAGK